MKLRIYNSLNNLYKLNKSRLFFLFVCILVDALSNIINLSLFYPLISSLSGNFTNTFLQKLFNISDNNALLRYLIILLILSSVIKLFLNTRTVFLMSRYIEDIRILFTNRIANSYINKRYSDIAFLNKGSLINNWFNEVVGATRFIRSTINAYSSLIQCIAIIIAGLIIDKKSMLYVLIIIVFISIFISKKYIFSALHFSAKKIENNSGLVNIMDEILTNYREIKILGLGKYFSRSVNISIRELARDSANSQIQIERPKVISEFMLFLIFSVICYGSLVLNPDNFKLILPKIIFYFLIFYKLSSQFTQLLTSIIRSLNDISSFDSCVNALRNDKNIEKSSFGKNIKNIKKNIIFRNVTFHHSDRKVLNKFNCTISNGSVIAFTGVSGIGKSTILDLLLQIQIPNQGNIFLDKVPISNFSLSSWRNCFGFVSQDITLFNDSIRNNFKMVNRNISDAEIYRLTKISGCDEVIKKLPEGLSTLVGSRGAKLSGGQRKRIAIARALIRKPSFLILDEVTTSFEKSLESAVINNIKKHFPSITILIVTHRLTNPKLYDYIIKI